jgi:hypothetical protein
LPVTFSSSLFTNGSQKTADGRPLDNYDAMRYDNDALRYIAGAKENRLNSIHSA